MARWMVAGRKRGCLALAGLLFALGVNPGAQADYSQWSASIPAGERDFWQDADEDGIRNGMEYLCGLNPVVPDEAGPEVGFALSSSTGVIRPNVDLALPVNAPVDLVLRLEASQDLGTWTAVAHRYGSGAWIMQQGALEQLLQGNENRVRWSGAELQSALPGYFFRFSVELVDLTDDDGDGMPEQWEREFSLDPLVDDSGADPDEDGLSNGEEFQAGSNPRLGDTDGDGRYDAYEVAAGSNPAVVESGQGGTETQPETGLIVFTP